MFNQIYFSGCSHTAGGGLYEARDWYKQQGINITRENTREFCYPRITGKLLNLPVIDESISGTGAIKIITDVHRYIERVGQEESHKTLFVLQFNESILRLHMWSNQLEDYYNSYVWYTEKGEIRSIILDEYVAPGKFKNEDIERVSPYLESYIIDSYSPIEYENEIRRRLMGFISFMEVNNYSFIFTCERLNSDQLGILSKNQFMPAGTQSIHLYAVKTETTVWNIAKFPDGHPSIEAHRDYAHLLADLIKQKYFLK